MKHCHESLLKEVFFNRDYLLVIIGLYLSP